MLVKHRDRMSGLSSPYKLQSYFYNIIGKSKYDRNTIEKSIHLRVNDNPSLSDVLTVGTELETQLLVEFDGDHWNL